MIVSHLEAVAQGDSLGAGAPRDEDDEKDTAGFTRLAGWRKK